MAHNTDQILKVIKAHPGIRQVEIADKVDCDFDAVPHALKTDVEMGNVLRKWVTGPNGVQQVSYTLAQNFEMSVDDDEPEPVKEVAPTPTPTPAPVTPEKPKSKVQLALDYMATVDKADDVSLRKAMGLHLGANVRAYLATQLQKRQVIQVAGGFYKMGDGKPLVKVDAKGPTDAERVAQNDEQARLLREELAKVPPHNGDFKPEDIKRAMDKEEARKSPDLMAITPEVLASVRSKLEAAGLKPIDASPPVSIVKLTKEQADQVLAAKGATLGLTVWPTPDSEVAKTVTPQRPFACAVWSDDNTLELSRNGQIIATLTEKETKTMLKYLVNHNFS